MAKFSNIKPGVTVPYLQPAPRGAVMDAISQVQDFACGICSIKYRGLRPGCPLCEAHREVQSMRNALKQVQSELQMSVESGRKLKAENDIGTAIREAAMLLGDEDMEFLKLTLYQWRDEKTVSLKVTHTKAKRGKPAAANGFIVIPRHGDPYGHTCTSMGGLAIAQYFDDGVNSQGLTKAMSLLARGMAPYLPGGTR